MGRFSSAMETHSGSIFYFIPVLIIGFLPFTYFALRAIGGVRSYFEDDLKLYLFIWFAFVFLFFSFSGTKLPHYVIYGYTPLFILSALYVQTEVRKGWLIVPILLLTVILFFFPDIATLIKETVRDQLAVVLIENAYDTFDWGYRGLILSVVLLLVFLLLKVEKKEYVLLGVAASMVIIVNYIVIPTYGKLMQQPIKEAALLAKKEGYQDIIMHKVNTPSFNVYYEGLVRKTKPQNGDIVFTKVPKLKEFQNYETLYQKNGFALIKVNN